MRHLARRHEITYLVVRRPGRSRRPTSTACARCARERRSRSRARDPAKGTLRVLRGRGAAPRRPAARTPSASTARARTGSGSRALLATGGFDLVVCDFLPPAVNLPERAALPGGALHAQRRAGDLAAARGDGATRAARGCSTAQQWRRMLRFEARDAARASTASSRCRTPTGDTFAAALSRRRCGSRCTSSRPASTPTTSRRAPSAVRPRAPGLHRLDGLAAERRRDAVLLPRRSCRSSARDEPDVDADDRRPRADAGGASSSAAEHGVEVTGRVDDVRPYMATAAVYIVPLRIGGGTRLKIFEAMAMGKAVVSTTVGAEGLPVDRRRAPAARRRAARVRARGRAPAPRARRARAHRSKRPRARWSSSATTGRRCAGISKQALDAAVAVGARRPRDATARAGARTSARGDQR